MLRRLVPLCLVLVVVSSMAVAAAGDPTVAARVRFFGAENVDPVSGAVRADRVILSWFGVTNFAAAIGGHVVLLDAWVPRGEYSGYVPTSPQELALLRPEAVFLGHGHFDHAADAAEILGASDAKLVGTPEHCEQAASQLGAPVECVEAVPPGTPPGTVGTLDDLLPGVGITVVKHVHSAAEPPDPDPSERHLPAAPPPDQGMLVQHLPAPQDTVHLISHLGDGELGTLLWRFSVGNLDLVWHDSSGPLKERSPETLDVIASIGQTDVQLGAIMGFNQLTNGMRDPRMYVEALAPKVFVPIHHDNWAPGITTRGEGYRPVIEEELAKIPAERRPVMRFIGDPQDYVRPEVLTFEVGNAYWD